MPWDNNILAEKRPIFIGRFSFFWCVRRGNTILKKDAKKLKKFRLLVIEKYIYF